MATTAKHRRPPTAAAAPADDAEMKQRGSPLYGVAEDESPDDPRDGTAAAHQSCELGTLSPMELQVYYDQLPVDRPAILRKILNAKKKDANWKVAQAERTAMGYCKHERCVATQTEDQTTQTKGMRKQMDQGNWRPAVAGVNVNRKKKVITKGKRKHVGMSKVGLLRGRHSSDADDTLQAACLAYDSDYSDADTL